MATAKFHCPSINCPGTDEPIINTSAEAPDPVEFLCAGFGPTFPPPLNSGFSQTRGVAFAQSIASLDEACLIAQRNAVNNATDNDNPWTDPTPTQYFKNAAQTCSFTCVTNGVSNTATYTTPANTFTSLSQNEADSLAHQYACLTAQLNAQAQFGCNEAFVNQPQTCQFPCASGTVYTGNVPAGTFSAVSQSAANQLAYDYACLLAQIQAALDPNCQTSTPPTPPPNVKLYLNTPQSCTSKCPDGSSFVFTVPAGRFMALSQIEANRMAYSYACLQAARNKICITATNPANCCTGALFNTTLSVVGIGVGPLTDWEIVSGSLPPGLTLASGMVGPVTTISGTPTLGGTFNFTVRATNVGGNYIQKAFTYRVGGLNQTDPLPQAYINDQYSTLLTATGMVPPENFTIISGSLPTGLTLDQDTGIISGSVTNTAFATYPIVVRVKGPPQ